MSIKKKLKVFFDPLVKILVTNKTSWKVVGILLRTAEWFRFQRSQFDNILAERQLSIHFKSRTVQNGFFKGLKYPTLKSFGSSIYPKLLGSYEHELYPVLLDMEKKNFYQIVDIGCAEGYYAVGLALKFPDATVYAFDIDAQALEGCKAMAKENKVSERVITDRFCYPETLENFSFSEKALIICDCEGYERELFNLKNIRNLKFSDLIIELHPFIHEDVKEYLISLFADTHNYNIISSSDNKRKVFDFKYHLGGMNKVEQVKAIEEGRPFTMEWVILKSKLCLNN